MSAYPPALKQAAKNLLDNEDFLMLSKHRFNELKEAVTMETDKEDIIKAHTEFYVFRDYMEWISMLGEGKLRG